MPLKLNIGLSRKIGEPNYGSRGASVNVEAEFDPSLVTDPAKFQERVRQLFGLVRTSLAEELNGNGHHNPTGNGPDNRAHSNGNGAEKSAQSNGNGAHAYPQSNGNGNGAYRPTTQRGSLPRPATASQCKAVYAISRGQGINLNELLRERFQVGRPDDLTLKDASSLIDELKRAENGG